VTGYLLDTNVVSAFAPGRSAAAPQLGRWLEEHTDLLFLSVISIVEVEAGISNLQRTGAKARAELLTAWIEQILGAYSERVLAFDLAAGRVAGTLSDRARAAGSIPGFADIAIAATAQRYELVLLTGNVKDFRATGVRYVNPFESLPD
jgi:predicted nucleic acid-binding protein